MKSPIAPPPLTLHVETTNSCNLDCVMCFQQTMERKKGRIDFDFYKAVINQASGWVHHLQLANFGEPLLHPQIVEMVEYAATHGFFVELFTNGTLLTEERARALIAAGVGKINISIDALDPAVYHGLRGTELAPVLENLRTLRRLRDASGKPTPFLVVAGSDLQGNPGQPERIRREHKSLGADSWYVTPSMNWAGNADQSSAIKQRGSRVRGCLFPWYLMAVSREGIVTPCCIDAELRNAGGTFPDMSLGEIWNGESMQRLRRALLSGDLATLHTISHCDCCSRLYVSQNMYTLNRGRVELAQLMHFIRS